MEKELLTFYDLSKKFLSYNNKKDLELVKRAFEYASLKHLGMKRLTGEDYINHPLNVAYILMEIGADVPTICAGLLHDVLEDCDVTEEELQKEFDLEITSLIMGVTKINKLNFSGETEVMNANHQKIIVGLSEDVRVIIIKLADRLHNMRTLWALPLERQKIKAKETLDILIPIAHRLGMNQIKGELEDLSLRYLKKDVYYSIVESLNHSKKEQDDIIKLMVETVSDLLLKQGIKNEVKGRAKSIFSIYKKLDTGRKFSDIYDILALRVFVDTEQECYQALGIIHSKYHPIPKRFKDYIAMPKTNMYQSLHTTVFGLEGNLFEIQIRTYEMDRVAEYGIASHWSYKEKGKKGSMQSTMEQKLQFFRSIIELQDANNEEESFIDSVKKDIFNDTIYVFSPKGDVVELPNGSTPIDFAYKVHTEVGNKMVGALVNGNIVPLDYQLKSDDIIKININKNSLGPNKEWLNIVKTTQAKNKIKAFYNRSIKEDNIKKGEELITKELRKRKIPINRFLKSKNIEKILEELKLANIEELYTSIGSGNLSSSYVINIIVSNSPTKEELILKKTLKKEVVKPIIKNDIIVKGIDNLKINIASCCCPIPGDEIVGYITKGHGISVHRLSCPNVQKHDERIIDVKWNMEINRKYPVDILISSFNNENLLLNVIAKTSNYKINVQNVKSYTKNNDYLLELIVLVDNKELIDKFIMELRTIPNVLSVERIIK